MIFIFIILCLMSAHGAPAADEVTANIFFRSDYTYIKEFDAFYKIQKTRMNFSEAIFVCKAEGAQLWLPTSLKESLSVISTKTFPLNAIWIGLHDMFFEGSFISLDGTPAENLYINWNAGEPNNHMNKEHCVDMAENGNFNDQDCSRRAAVICKKSAQGITYNSACETYDIDYKFSLDTDTCYKFHSTPHTWQEAFKICRSEMANLVTINSEYEANFLAKEFSKYPSNTVIGVNVDKNSIFVGFSDLLNNGLYLTVEGKTLSEAGYAVWAPGQPDNYGPGGEHCGAMTREGKLNDLNCGATALFACEKTLTSPKRTSVIMTDGILKQTRLPDQITK